MVEAIYVFCIDAQRQKHLVQYESHRLSRIEISGKTGRMQCNWKLCVSILLSIYIYIYLYLYIFI